MPQKALVVLTTVMLKAAKQELAKGNYYAALVTVENILEDDSTNYNALLIQGKCYQDSEPAKALSIYQKAATVDPSKEYAWKGAVACAVKLKNSSELLKATTGLILALEDKDPSGNRPLALDHFQKTQKFVERGDSNEAKRDLLRLQLAGSPIYHYLGPLFSPQEVTLAGILTEERHALKLKLNQLRGRSKNSVGFSETKFNNEQLKIYNASEIPQVLEQLIDVTPNDEQRRHAELELLDLKYQVLYLTPKKPTLCKQVQQLADDMILFRPPAELPYLVHWDWMDVESYEKLDPVLIRIFIELFPEHGLAKIWDAFLHSALNPFASDSKRSRSTSDEEEEENDENAVWTHQEIVEALETGYESASSSILANRIITDFAILSEEWEKAVQYTREGIRLVRALKLSTSKELPVTKLQLSLQLATAYIYYQAPKNFGMAEELFQAVLKDDPENETAQIGTAQLLAETHQLDKALDKFSQLVKKNPENYTAISELAWVQVRTGKIDNAQKNIHISLELALKHGSAQQIADRRALLFWRLGYSYWVQEDLKNAFESFVSSLQQNPSFAPAYSYLGLFYQRQGDTARSTRCFYKALEIDAGEIIAAHCLVTSFAAESQWDIVEIITARLLESGKSVDPLTGEKIDWPYRVLGIACLNRRDYPEAVKYFQKCLRLAPSDANSWVGLGEAYIHSGRYRSAEKALLRALEIEPENLNALYELSLAHRETLKFPEAAQAIKTALTISSIPELRGALVDNYAMAAQSYLQDSRLGDAIDIATEGVRTAATDFVDDNKHGAMWSSVATCIDIFLQAQTHRESVPFEVLEQLVALAGDSIPRDDEDLFLSGTMVMCLKQAVEHSGKSRGSRAAAAFNLGLGYYKSHALVEDQESLGLAVEQLKKAITLETRNFEYWNIYGVIVQSINPRIAQHCFVRSLNLFSRSSATWANLGLLYLGTGDIELASEAFDRSLSVNPDESSSWVGQALGDYLTGKDTEHVMRLFEHSYLISSGKDRVSRLLFGLFSSAASRKSGRVDHNAVGALEQLLGLDPKTKKAIQTYATLLERSGDYDESLNRLLPVASDAHQHSQLSRLYLGRREWQKSIEHANIALDLEPEEESIQLSCVLTTGLAQYFSEDFESALETFSAALELTENSQDVVVLLAQVLWESGGEDERDAAMQQLFESVDDDESSVKVSLVLAVIGLLNKDTDIIDATKEALDGASTEQLTSDRGGDIPFVLSQLEGSSAPLYRALMYEPAKYSVWKHVNSEMALTIAQSTGTSCQELSDAYISAGDLASARRAVFYSPASEDAWIHLARCGAKSVQDVNA